MKKLIAFSAAILLFAGCKKDTPAPPGPNEWIVGYWQMTDLDVTGSINVAGNALPIIGQGENFSGGFNLNANKTATYDAACDVALTIPGLPSQSVPYSMMGNGTWKLTNNATILEVLESTGQTTIFPIKVLTANIMIVEQDSTFNMAGVSGSLTYEVTLKK